MRNYIVLIFLFTSLSSLAFTIPSSPPQSCEKEGEIIAFDVLTCGDCWGWIIRVGEDTIKKRDKKKHGMAEKFGYDKNLIS